MELRERILGVLERDQLRALTFIFPVQVDRRRPEEMRSALAAMPAKNMPIEGLLKALDTPDLEQVCARLGVSAGRSRASMLGALLAAPADLPAPAEPPIPQAAPAPPQAAPPQAAPQAAPPQARPKPPPWPEVERQMAPPAPPVTPPPAAHRGGYDWAPDLGPPEPPDEVEPPQVVLFALPERPRPLPHSWAARSVEEHRTLPGAVRAGARPSIPALPPRPAALPPKPAAPAVSPKPAPAVSPLPPAPKPAPVVATPPALPPRPSAPITPKPAIAAPTAIAAPAAPIISAALPKPVAPVASRPAGARKNFTAIDFETADNGRDSACSVALVRVVGGEIKEVESFLIRPPRAAFLFTHIHGITWEMVKGEPTFKQRWPQIQRMLEGSELLVAHNASFDRSVLEACCRGAGLPGVALPFACTVQAAKAKWGLSSAKLPIVCELLKIPLQHHDARSDAMACAKIALAAGVDLR